MLAEAQTALPTEGEDESEETISGSVMTPDSNPDRGHDNERELPWLGSTLQDLVGVLGLRNPGPTKDRTEGQQLGRKALGPFAYEAKVPLRLRKQLETEPRVPGRKQAGGDADVFRAVTGPIVFGDLVETIGELAVYDDSVESVWLCHPAVQYIAKTKKESNFCGYRNIQMLISYIIGSGAQGHEKFSQGNPSILGLQVMIEEAWDKGINSGGRRDTGGIKETRKYIGTPEAQSLFRGLDIPCRVGSHGSEAGKASSWDSLLSSVRQYFQTPTTPSALSTSKSEKVNQTNLPPIYLQRPRHSLTIIGLETRSDGSSNLLVFDPAYRPSSGMARESDRLRDLERAEVKVTSKDANRLLRPYRRGKREMGRFKNFETLRLMI